MARAQFQSTPPVRRATCSRNEGTSDSHVSIHAPRAEGDEPRVAASAAGRATFQSTPPVRRATSSHCICSVTLPFQSTPPVRRATVEGARIAADGSGFQSTPPVRRATRPPQQRRCPILRVSIHAPRAEGDAAVAFEDAEDEAEFQSTPPVRRATCPGCPRYRTLRQVSIHAPRAEGDRRGAACELRGAACCFNPRPPCGGRQDSRGSRKVGKGVSIHAPRAEGDIDWFERHVRGIEYVSIHAPRAEGDAGSIFADGSRRFLPFCANAVRLARFCAGSARGSELFRCKRTTWVSCEPQ